MRTRLAALPLLFVWPASPLFAQQLPGTPELALRDLNGEVHSIRDYRGKIVILNFWATWCVPCRAEMPLLVSIYHRYSNRDVVVIGASADESSTQDQIPAFLRKLKITFPVWLGATTNDMTNLGLGTGLPATAFIDREGTITGRVLGLLE